MKVRLRTPEREVEVTGPKRVKQLLAELGVNPDTVLVIRDKTLITREDRIDDADEVEIRPVISGGCGGVARPRVLRTPFRRAGEPPAARGCGP